MNLLAHRAASYEIFSSFIALTSSLPLFPVETACHCVCRGNVISRQAEWNNRRGRLYEISPNKSDESSGHDDDDRPFRRLKRRRVFDDSTPPTSQVSLSPYVPRNRRTLMRKGYGFNRVPLHRPRRTLHKCAMRAGRSSCSSSLFFSLSLSFPLCRIATIGISLGKRRGSVAPSPEKYQK